MPDYTPGELSGGIPDQFEQFNKIIDEARRNGIINSPPGSDEETYDLQSQRIRIQTIASRLWLLGYLQRKIGPRSIHKKIPEIRAAVFQFQNDAGLKKDHWVGNKTWYALDQLVSFESEVDYSQWFKDGIIHPEKRNACHRAVQLRLWCLGLYPNKPNRNFRLLNKRDLRNFASVLSVFRVKKDAEFEADLNQDTFKILFNQEELTSAIAARSSKDNKRFLFNFSQSDGTRKRELAKKFIINCAKIELWLLGYKVKIDGMNNYAYAEGSKLHRAISQFYRHMDDTSGLDPDKLALEITPGLFIKLASINSEPETGSHMFEDFSTEVMQELNSDDEINKAWAFLKN